MHFSFPHLLVMSAVVGSVILVLHRGDRLLPVVAVVSSGLMALIQFGVVSFSVARYRIDVILPAIFGVAGAICWARSETKPTITASVVVLFAAAIQVLGGLGIIGG
jgi:hypothetical protein